MGRDCIFWYRPNSILKNETKIRTVMTYQLKSDSNPVEKSVKRGEHETLVNLKSLCKDKWLKILLFECHNLVKCHRRRPSPVLL